MKYGSSPLCAFLLFFLLMSLNGTFIQGNAWELDWKVHEGDSPLYTFANGLDDRIKVFRSPFDVAEDYTMGFSTYLGGINSERGLSVAVDLHDNVITSGWTQSSDFPAVNAYEDTHNGDSDCFVIKFTSAGNLEWSTYLGGSNEDKGWGIIDDSQGNILVAGWTRSPDFPTVNAYDATLGGDSDCFVTKFASNGSLVWSTLLGGENDEMQQGYWGIGPSITIDPQDNIIITGLTSSTDFPTLNAYDGTHNGGEDCFVTKLASDGTLVWSTYLGGTDDERGKGVTVDSQSNVIVTGDTGSAEFPILNAYDETHNGDGDCFVTKLDSDGTLEWSTFLGGSYGEYGHGIITDSQDNIIIAGQTSSETDVCDFPALNGYDDTYNGDWDGFVTKFTSNGTLEWSTYLGGDKGDGGMSVAIDSYDNVIVTGAANRNFPTVNAYDNTFNGASDDCFLTKFTTDGSLVWSTYWGGNAVNVGWGVAVDSQDNIAVTGWTGSSDFPTANSFDKTHNGGEDVFLSKLSASGTLPRDTTIWHSTTSGNDQVLGPYSWIIEILLRGIVAAAVISFLVLISKIRRKAPTTPIGFPREIPPSYTREEKKRIWPSRKFDTIEEIEPLFHSIQYQVQEIRYKETEKGPVVYLTPYFGSISEIVIRFKQNQWHLEGYFTQKSDQYWNIVINLGINSQQFSYDDPWRDITLVGDESIIQRLKQQIEIAKLIFLIGQISIKIESPEGREMTIFLTFSEGTEVIKHAYLLVKELQAFIDEEFI